MAIDWQAVRKGFEAGVAEDELAKGFGCNAGTVRRRATKERWKTGERRKAGKKTAALGAAADHRSLLNGVKRRLVKGLENEDVKKGLEELKVAKTALEVLSDYMKEEKLALGLVEKVSEEQERKDAEALAVKMAQATAPSGTDEALERGEEVRGCTGGKKERQDRDSQT